MKKEIKVIRTGDKVKQGVFQEKDGSYTWMTYTRSGNVKTLKTAMRKAGF